jgi:hypothetical protein
MTRELALSLLRQGDNGNSILQILDTLTADVEQENNNNNAPTLQEVQF